MQKLKVERNFSASNNSPTTSTERSRSSRSSEEYYTKGVLGSSGSPASFVLLVRLLRSSSSSPESTDSSGLQAGQALRNHLRYIPKGDTNIPSRPDKIRLRNLEYFAFLSERAFFLSCSPPLSSLRSPANFFFLSPRQHPQSSSTRLYHGLVNSPRTGSIPSVTKGITRSQEYQNEVVTQGEKGE